MLCSQLERIHTLFRRQLGIPLLGESLCTGGDGLNQPVQRGFRRDYSSGRAMQIAAVVLEHSLLGYGCLSLGSLE